MVIVLPGQASEALPGHAARPQRQPQVERREFRFTLQGRVRAGQGLREPVPLRVHPREEHLRDRRGGRLSGVRARHALQVWFARDVPQQAQVQPHGAALRACRRGHLLEPRQQLPEPRGLPRVRERLGDRPHGRVPLPGV